MAASSSSGDEGSVCGGSSMVVAETRIAQRKQVQSQGPRLQLRCYIVVGDPVLQPTASARKAIGDGGDHHPLVHGLMLAELVVSTLDSPTDSDQHAGLRAAAMRHVREIRTVKGYVEYKVYQYAALDQEPFALEGAVGLPEDVLQLVGQSQAKRGNHSDASATPRLESVGSILNEWGRKAEVVRPLALAVVPPDIAAQVVRGDSKYAHCVAMTSKLNRKRLLVPSDPPKKRLKIMSENCKPLQGLQVFKWNGSRGTRDALFMLDWLDASQDLKDQRAAKATCRKFAKLLSRKSGVPVDVMMKDMEFVSGRLLNKSRVRLDCAAMLLHRRWWAVQLQSGEPISVHLLCDSSPQWRGVELFAATFDIVVGGRLVQRLAPLVSLGKTQLDLSGKVAALLWQAFLLTGPSFASLKDFCGAVRSVTADLGTERLLADCGSCLGHFFKAMFPNEPSEEEDAPGMSLFEYALFAPGFRHMVDNWLQRGLSSMTHFPAFLVKLKSLVKFLRSEPVLLELCRGLEAGGASGLADMLKQSKLVSFAAWRWGTLGDVCKALSAFLASLVERFDPEPFADQRDSTEFKHVLGALRSPLWNRFFWFVKWFADWLTPLMEWVGGCPCHRAGDEGAATCHRKGRRLAEASSKVADTLSFGLAQANDWTPNDFGGDAELWAECQGAVRFTCGLAREKVAYLEKVPYLLTRLPEAGVRARCLAQFDSVPPEKHHRITRWFLDPNHPKSLRQAVDEMNDSGKMSPTLQAAVESLGWVPIDDCICEGPHARAKRIKTPASSGQWTWVAASMRLQQNLEDCNHMPDEVGTSLQSSWTSYATVIQPSRNENKFPRMKRAALERRLYRLEHLRGFDARASLAAVPALGNDSNATGVLKDRCGAGASSGVVVEDIVIADGEPVAVEDEGPLAGGGAIVPGNARGAVGVEGARRRNDDIVLLRQLFAATLQRHKYFSIPVISEAGEASIQVLQLLDLERRNIIVRPFLDLEDEAELDSLYSVLVQPVELWRGGVGPEPDLAATLNIFVLQEPAKVDIATVCGARVECRHEIKLWCARESDLEGCTELYNPKTLSTLQLDLFSSQAPVLALVDALDRAGFVGVDEEVDHAQGRIVFDARRLAGRRAYLQCVLYIDKLIAKGVTEFSSAGSQAYFDALLRGQHAVRPGLPAASYRQILAAERHSAEAPSLMDVQQVPPKRQRRLLPQRPQPLEDGSSSDCSIAGGGAGAESDASSVAGGLGEVGAAPAEPARAEPEQPVEHLAALGGIPEEILGAKVTHILGRRTRTHTYSDRLTVKCTNPAHLKCSKSRSLAMLRDKYGQRCAEVFLGAWLARADDMTSAEHLRHTPDEAAMRAYLAAHP